MEQSTKEYVWIERAFNHFNKHLFDNQLPGVFFTYRRQKGAAAIFSFKVFKKRQSEKKEQISEIGLNPNEFEGHTDIEILSHLVHEMCHAWQYYCGKPTRAGYHNREWAAKMESIGLMPSDTGKPGGKKTGQRMSDYIIPGHYMFERQAKILIKRGFKITWESFRMEKRKKGRSQDSPKNKIKYTCPQCWINAWGKPDLKLKCGVCDLPLLRVKGQDDTG